ncbi:MAG: DUF305 domain-containing protein [Kibdelosporangium sp.]
MMLPRFLAGLLLTLALAGCGGETATAPAAVTDPVTGTGAGQFGLTERAFVELAIATDDQAVKLLDLGVQRVTTPALRDLATEVDAARHAELTELRGLLTTEKIPYVNNHEGHDMPGMPTNEELAALSQAGPQFDTVFKGLLRAHLDESSTVARSALQAVTHDATRAVAQRMEQDRRAFLQRLGGSG